MRVCVVYDCLYPWTVGGAERWTRRLAEALVAAGHDVTYLTRRQWSDDEAPEIPGVRVVAVAPGGELYRPDGTRRLGPPVRFGWGVLRHLLRHRRDYDVVHTASFPYFSLLAVGIAFRGLRFVDWHEVWPRAFWREYAGRLAGTVGWLVQRRCVAIDQRAFCFSAMNERRLREVGFTGEVVRLPGLYDGPLEGVGPDTAAAPREPRVLAAGRMLSHKRLELVPAAAALAGAPAEVLGDGPQRDAVAAAGDADLPGFVDHETLEAALARATCLVQPSAREGYGMIVVEAAAAGTPSVVVTGPETAASELVEDGVNGVLVDEPDAEALAAAIRRVHEAGPALRRSTAEWFAANGLRLSLATSLDRVVDEYRRACASA